MLKIELDINGRKIGTIGVWNTQEQNDDGEIRYQVHDLRGYRMHGGEITDYPKITDVWHHREGGASALTAAVMDRVPESRLDQQ